MSLDYLYEFDFDKAQVNAIIENVDDKVFTELGLFQEIVKENITYMRDFGIENYRDVFTEYPHIFLRDAESFKNVFYKFDKEDLIAKVHKKPAVFRKMVEFVDNN